MAEDQQSGSGPSEADALKAAKQLDNPTNSSTGDDAARSTQAGEQKAQKKTYAGGKIIGEDALEKAYLDLEKDYSSSEFRLPDEAINTVLDKNPGMSRKEAAKVLRDAIASEFTKVPQESSKTQQEESPKEPARKESSFKSLPRDVQESVLYAREARFKEEHPEASAALAPIRLLRDKPEFRNLSDSEIFEHPDNTWMRETFGKKDQTGHMPVAGGVESRLTRVTPEKVKDMNEEDLEALARSMS